MKIDKYIKPSFWLTIIGILINLAFIELTELLQLPIYLDTIGTIIVASAGGVIPGMTAGFFTNFFVSIVHLSPDAMTMYYGFINALIAVATVHFTRRGYLFKWKGKIGMIFAYALIGGGLGTVVTWLLYGFSYGQGVTKPIVLYLNRYLQIHPIIIQLTGDLSADIVDKIVSVFCACVVLRFVPDSILEKLPLGYIHIQGRGKDRGVQENLLGNSNNVLKRKSINSRVTFLTLLSAGLLCLVALLVGGIEYYTSIRKVFPADTIRINVAIYLIRMASMLFGLMLILSVITIWYCNKYLVYPIRILAKQAKGMTYVGNKNGKRVRDQYAIATGDELEDVFQDMCHTEDKIVSYVAEVKKKNHEISKMQRNIIFTLANMVENRDEGTGGHIKRTAQYVKMIGTGLRKKHIYEDLVSKKYVKKLYDSAPLHDIGKIKIPDSVLNKPGKLTEEEFETIKTHTTEGRHILKISLNEIEDESWLTMAVDMAMYHHEKWDGTGYPQGLKEENIPLCARIMAVADVFDALVSDRSYKKAFPYEQAMQIIKEGAGAHFDPQIVDVFLGCGEDIKKIMREVE